MGAIVVLLVVLAGAIAVARVMLRKRREARERHAQVMREVTWLYEVRFSAVHDDPELGGRWYSEPWTSAQCAKARAKLDEHGLPYPDFNSLSKGQVSDLIGLFCPPDTTDTTERMRLGLPVPVPENQTRVRHANQVEHRRRKLERAGRAA